MGALLDIVKKGATDRSVTLRIVDSGDGTPETGVVYNTAGIDLWYRREGAAKVSITEATLSALTDAHADGGFLHISDGEYRLDLPDAAFATGANHVDVGGTITGMIVIGGRVRLVNYDPEDAVRLGLTALPNAAAEAAGGLYTRGTGAGQINQDANGRIDAHLNNAAHGGGAAVLTLERMIVTATTSNQPALKLTGNGGAPGFYSKGGATGEGADILAGAGGGAGLYVVGGSQAAVLLEGGAGQEGLVLVNGSGGSTLTTNIVGTVSGIAGTLQTIDALWAKIKKYFQLLFRKDSAIATDNATELTEINANGGSGAGAFANTTDSVEAIRDNMSTPPTAGSIADAVWDEARSGHTTSGTFGEGVKAESLNSQAQSDVEAVVDGVVQDYRLHELIDSALSGAPVAGSLFGDLTEDDGGTQRFTANALEQGPTGTGLDAAGVRAAVGLASANLDTQLGDLPTAGENADAVWDEARSGHSTSGTFGESFNGVVSGQAATGTLSTTEMTTNLTEATDDHYIGRIIVWITGALAGQATDITDYVGSTKKLVFSAVTDTPSNGDRFVIV